MVSIINKNNNVLYNSCLGFVFISAFYDFLSTVFIVTNESFVESNVFVRFIISEFGFVGFLISKLIAILIIISLSEIFLDGPYKKSFIFFITSSIWFFAGIWNTSLFLLS